MSAESDRWGEVLDELERDVAAAHSTERPGDVAAAAVLTNWIAPADLGTLPAELAPRARAVLAAQAEALALLATRQRDVARQLAAVQSVPTPSLERQPIYLDFEG